MYIKLKFVNIVSLFETCCKNLGGKNTETLMDIEYALTEYEMGFGILSLAK